MTRYQFIFFYVVFCFALDDVCGQTKKMLRGTVVLDNIGTLGAIELNNVNISNLTKKISTKPDNLGNFLIGVQIGDSLEFYLQGLPSKHITITSYEHLTVYLDSTILLEEVNISAHIDKKTNLKETAIEYSRQNSIYFNGRPPIILLSPFSGSPITFFRELLGKDGKKVRRFNSMVEHQLEIDELEAKFNTQNIKRAVPTISDEEMESFRAAYTPDLEKLRRWSTYELFDYIKQSYEHFKQEH